MHLSKRDSLATALVGLALVLTSLSATEVTSTSDGGIRATGVAVLLLGFIASAAAVVPSFDRLLHGNIGYLVGMSALGVVAFAAGVHMLVTASATSLAVLMAVTVVLWLFATVHHVVQHPSAAAGRHAANTG